MKLALKLAVGCVAALLLIRYGIFFAFAPKPYSASKGYSVPNSSMAPSIIKGDRIFVLKYNEAGLSPQRLDPVAFVSTEDGQTRLARIVGLPDETIELKGGRILINEKPLESSVTYYSVGAYGSEGQKTKVPPDTYFLLGDNGGMSSTGMWQSKDSRFLGPLSRQELVGVVKTIYWPISRAGQLPSNHSLDRTAAR